ncbi:hypothetical protein AAFF_G00193780 [Aldrovandia affinis]|uniref:Uncharacterized protein n=1 Tax=Aldrovandia affinis TaxID=143900 RepID=A0AAD7WW58_9TELE|nr:hypothetical protein AAFF_G00193780 [Aldrovandia affinis]
MRPADGQTDGAKEDVSFTAAPLIGKPISPTSSSSGRVISLRSAGLPPSWGTTQPPPSHAAHGTKTLRMPRWHAGVQGNQD